MTEIYLKTSFAQFNQIARQINHRRTFLKSQITNFPPSKKDTKYFAVSPDENQIAFCEKTDGQTDIWTMPISGGEKFRLTNDKDEEIRPNWHADGERIFYTAYRNGHYGINLAFADGSEPVQITRGDGEYDLINVSADGTKIFYYSWQDKSDLWGVKVDSGEEFEVAAETEAEFWADISPDGESIAFQINSSSFVPPEISSSSIVVKSLGEMKNQNSFRGYNQKWSPDNRRIAFLRWQEVEQKYNLWLFDTVNGSENQITTEGIAPTQYSVFPFNRTQTANYSWSPDGKKIVYIDSPRQNILMTSVDIEETLNLTDNDNPKMNFYCPIWSPDGNRVAYVSLLKPSSPEEKAIWKIWLSEQDKSSEIFSTSESLRFLGWSSSNNELFFETTEGAMKSSPTDIKLLQISTNGKAKNINSFEQIAAMSMTLSADGKSVAFTARLNGKDNIYTASTENGVVKKITVNANPDFCFGSLKWSPDGKMIFFDKQEEINIISMFDNFK